ncbi:MAG: hypothetical protein PHH98_01295 [Candidatus Gracilibacteria bacterium]|nr:hypothetical protein [Candidatus Gracilibacteria bacterium]
MKSIFSKILILIFLSLSLTSCDSVLSGVGNLMCSRLPDSDHCYQFTAVQSGSPDACDKIKGTKFKDSGSNPPRDKCYLTIAQNKEDYTICSKIQGGPMSYTKSECEIGVGEKILTETILNDDINGCGKINKIPNLSKVYDDCVGQLATKEKLDSKDEKIDDLVNQLKSDPGNKELKKQLDDLKKQKENTYNMMSESQKSAYFSEKREAIMSGIEDEDVKSAISKEYVAYRNNETNINNLLDKLEDITKKQELIKSADEKANQLVDQVKEQLEGLVQDKQDEIIGEMGNKAKERIEENGGKELKRSLGDLEWAMGKYEKGSEMYNSAKSKYDKIKGAYDEIMGVYNRVDEVNKMLAEGKIDEGKAKVLKGAVLLDKGLEYATEYVPVFGSTISTVSKETFGVVIELAKKRAERSTALDNCFVDPANCDTDKISGY